MAEKKENSSEKKGTAAWLELPEAEKKFAAAAMRRQGGSYAHAADALEELAELRELVDALPLPAPYDANDRRNYQRLCDLLGLEEIEDDKGDLSVNYTGCD